MKHADFGHMDGPVVLFGGPYSNLQAMEAMASAIGDRDAICTGDVVGYCANPNETTTHLMARGVPVIAGNCEQQLAEGKEDCGCGFGEDSACDLLSRGWWPHLLGTASPETVSALSDLPEIGTFTHQSRRYAVIHGGATAINRFLWPSSDAGEFDEEIAAIEAVVGQVDGVVSGHSGIAFHRHIGRHQWINAGAIGLPPHDGRPETRYAVLTDGDVVIERLSYAHEAAAAAMETAGLTQGYHQTLRTGIWPSEDILPEALRR
ncbi:MAG: metallophosphoesterase family protein [Pseudomonadota bacterium]